MKNIAIFGASRSGKSTLAKMICKKYPNYHIIIGDAIRKAYSEFLPQNNINNKEAAGIIEDKDFSKFLACIFHRSIYKSQGDYNYIIDACDISPENAKELFERQDTKIIFLGYPKQTEEEHLIQIKKYEKKSDWSYYKTEEYMKKHAKIWTSYSREFEEKCKKLDICFVDTSFNRDKVLNETMNELEKIIL